MDRFADLPLPLGLELLRKVIVVGCALCLALAGGVLPALGV